VKIKEDTRIDALLVGYERQENLGLRSIMANLKTHGYRAELIPFYPDNNILVLTAAQQFNPRLIGFSLIFQYTLDEFGRLMNFLRSNGVTAHFTAGGHFPSLLPEETLELIPELDSIVRFEGEATLLDLLSQIEHPELWEKIPGLAFRNGSRAIMTVPRPFVADLDSLPLLSRDEPQQIGPGVKTAAMLASRGCLFNCSFCSIRQFYGSAQGDLRRVRSPQAVVNEMLILYNEKNVRFFSFQDDDFAARTPSQQKWMNAFLTEMDETGLAGKIRWKISCRVDDLEQKRLEKMINHGLIAVYLGVESGNDTGLRTLNKCVSVAQNLDAIDLLKQNNIAMAIGFMLFDPSSTIDTVKQNIHFLRTVGEDGYFPINFCKMLPYAGTRIEAWLREEGRLKGTVTQPDYGFSDLSLDWYEFLVQRMFSRRNFSPDGIVTLLQQADFDWRLTVNFAQEGQATDFGRSLNKIIRQTNILAIETLESMLDNVLTFGIEYLLKDQKRLVGLFENEWREEMFAEVRLKELCATAGIGALIEKDESDVNCQQTTK
jgi:anaerobic magnesium-protoporphyrin IX monomethyl ester cyclase